MTTEVIIAIAIGGAVGATARWSMGRFVARHTVWPGWTATLAVNLAGCLLIGLLVSLHGVPGALLIGGLCGGLTTFSSFALDLAMLLWMGRSRQAIVAASVSVIGGGLLMWAGLLMGGRA